jgi:serine O-acetyltransferase
MDTTFLDQLFIAHRSKHFIPSKQDVCIIMDELLSVLFPQLADFEISDVSEIKSKLIKVKGKLLKIIKNLNETEDVEAVVELFFNNLPQIYSMLLKDAEAICKGDPAAHNIQEVIRIYPGFLAIYHHRIAHELYKMNIKYLPRILSEDVHSKTGIDIHPGATIGEYFCIDHGTGIVIGETTNIGNWVKIYQGVTLGALSVDKNLAKTKRHPTIEDHVVIYSGATILGGKTVIGHHSIVGGNTWLTKSVEPNSKTYYKG